MVKLNGFIILLPILLILYLDISRIYVPDDFEKPFFFKMKSFLLGVGSNLARLGAYLNIGYEPIIFRNLVNLASKFSNAFKTRDGTVFIENTVFTDINVRIYTPINLKSSNKFSHPFMMFYHGGGYSIGNLDDYDNYLYELAKKTNIIIISVDYNLAPENVFPGPLNDCIKVTEYVLENHRKLKLDINRYIVAGDSAGGHAATYISQHLAKNNNKMPKLQILIYPWVQMYDFFLPSHMNYQETNFLSNEKFPLSLFMWWLIGIYENITKEMNDIFKYSSYSLLLDEETRKKYVDYLDINLIPEKYKKGKSYYNDYLSRKPNMKELPENHILIRNKELANRFKNVLTVKASPSLADAEILKLLPRAYFIIFEWDILKDQGLIYAERLKLNGVPTDVAFYENAYHGMVQFIDIYDKAGTILENLVKYINSHI